MSSQVEVVSFVVRFVREGEHQPWRGVVQHVQSGEVCAFRTWEEAQRFMEQFVQPASAGEAGEETGTGGSTPCD